MLAGLFGIAGIVACLFLAEAWEKQSGLKVAVFLTLVLGCFGVSIFGMSTLPDYVQCDDYSRFAASC